MRRHRELQREYRAATKLAEQQQAAQHKAAEKLAEQQQAAHEVAMYESYIALLMSVHKDCGDRWDWHAIATAWPPPAPGMKNAHEITAREQAAAYKPSFLDRMFGRDKQKAEALQQAIEHAKAADLQVYSDEVRQHQSAHHLWNVQRMLAQGVLAHDPAAYMAALDQAAPFGELAAFKTRIRVADARPDVVVLACDMMDEEIVPSEELKLTAAGKLSTKDMPATRYWALYQDHVCACAIRVAREVFAVLPIQRAIVNVNSVHLNTSTGHHEPVTILAVHFVRTTLEQLNFAAIDPSDAMSNFNRRMKFKKTAGFEPVEPITVEEQWVSA